MRWLVAPTTRRVRSWPFQVPIKPNGRVSGVVFDYRARHATYIGQASIVPVQAVCRRINAIMEADL
ncbi:MAG TPA: hypothetical protein VLI93_11395 [Acetobacteraceae bacterium]|nr:hypothetical protein [Acetobacteraceae bacterium]